MKRGMATRSGVRYRGTSTEVQKLVACNGRHHEAMVKKHAKEYKRLTDAESA